MKRLLLISTLIAALLLSSCSIISGSKSRVREELAPMAEESSMAIGAAPTDYEGKEYELKANQNIENQDISGERIVIKNANLSIVVANPTEAMDAIVSMTENMGGFVVNSNVYKTTTSSGAEVPVANITVRVPAEQLNQAMNLIKSLVENENLDVLREEVSGQDVTSEVTDLESRLRNLQEAEQQLLKIMDVATKTEDVMSVFRELTNVREQIEVLQGQIKYYRESARLSAVSVYIQSKEAIAPLTIGGWKPSIQVQKALQALINGMKYFGNFLIWLVIFLLPLAAVIGLPIHFIVKAIRKRRMQAKGKTEPKLKEKK